MKITDMKYDVVTLDDLAFDAGAPVFFDMETLGLYGKIRLAQFYQQGWPVIKLVEWPDPAALAARLPLLHIVGHNIIYDLSTIQDQLGKLRFELPRKLDDTLYMARLFFFRHEKFSLDACVDLVHDQQGYWTSVFGKPKHTFQQRSWEGTLTADQLWYAALDTVFCAHIFKHCKEVTAFANYILDIQAVYGYLDMQPNGLPVDRLRLVTLYNEHVDLLTELQNERGGSINTSSPKMVRDYLGSSDARDSTLAELSHPEIEDEQSLALAKKAINIREDKKSRKLIQYLDKFETENGRVYGHFSPNARTGRSICDHQNLQQIPRATKVVFGVPENGEQVLIHSDFSALEMRCVCAISGDAAMRDLFLRGDDPHTYAAQRIFSTETPTKEERQIAKTCNFALLYGAGPRRYASFLLESVGIRMGFEKAKKIKDDWLALWPGVKAWHNSANAVLGLPSVAYENLWATPVGRVYVASDFAQQLNFGVQGMGGEVAHLANHYIREYFAEHAQEYPHKEWQIHFVHDAFLFCVPNNPELYKWVCGVIATAMQEAWFNICGLREVHKPCVFTDIPMPVTVSVGWNWGDLEEGENVIYRLTRKDMEI